jgi:hypothetical protein
MATSLGKKARAQHSMNRHALRHASHTRKSEGKRRRMGWLKAGKMERNA